MKEKKAKVGRPTKKDKKVAYTFTVLESKKKRILKIMNKTNIDALLRETLYQYDM